MKLNLNKYYRKLYINAFDTSLIRICILGILFLAVAHFLGHAEAFLYIVAGIGILGALSLLTSFLPAMAARGRLKKRIKSLRFPETKLKEENFEKVSNEVYLGQSWMIYNKGKDLRIYNRNALDEIEDLSSSKKLGKKGVVTLKERGKSAEKLKFTKKKETQMDTRLREWKR